MVIKKSATPRALPPIHPGLGQKLREAEEAEREGKTPRRMVADAQKILRPTLDAREAIRRAQIRTIGLIEPVYRAEADGLGEIADSPAFRPGTDLDAVWDTLSEPEKIRAGATERFRLELEATLRRAAKPWRPPHVVARTLTGRVLRHLSEKLRSYASAFDDLLAPDTYALLIGFIDESEVLIRLSMQQRVLQGIEGPTLFELMNDLVQKLIYQELISRRRAMGDRGLRRICANIHLADALYAPLIKKRQASLRQRLLTRIIQVHQDLGHTAYAARLSFRGGKLHRAYGARIFTDEMNRYRPLLTHEELNLARAAVATHADPALPFSETLGRAVVRRVEHLDPFAPYRLQNHLKGLPAATDFLDDLLDRLQRSALEQFAAAKNALGLYLAGESGLPPVLQEDILASFRPVERQAEPYDLGAAAGSVDKLQLEVVNGGVLRVDVVRDPFDARYQVLFDTQQDQLYRVDRESTRALPLTGDRLRLGAGLDPEAGFIELVFRDDPAAVPAVPD